MTESYLPTTVPYDAGDTGRLRPAARLLAASSLDRRLDACRRFGVERHLEYDVVGRLVYGRRHRLGMREAEAMVPLGVVGLAEATLGLVADCIISGNAVAARGLAPEEVTRARSALLAAGLAEDALVAVESMQGVELDALAKPSGELVVAERVGSHRHVYVDAAADQNHATYVAVNAATLGTIDTIVFHMDYPAGAVNDVVTAMAHLGQQPTMVQARSLGEAVDVIDRRSSGEVECVLTTNLRVLHDLERRLDAAVLALNCSPSFATDEMMERRVEGFTRSRVLLEGEGQTKPLGEVATSPS